MSEIKNLKRAAERILRAIKDKERIILYGDADLDGAASVIILQETIHRCRSTVYFPDREKEGYGINVLALKFLSKYAPALFIALDLGITNVAEVDLAKKLGFEVIIIDHHQALGQLPSASIIVNPKQKSDKYPFKHLACAGIVYKLSKVLVELTPHHFFQKSGGGWRPERFLELVALATLYDQMPLESENQKLVKDGILALKYTRRPGLKVLLDRVALFGLTSLTATAIDQVRQKLVSPLAAGTVKKHISETYLLLIEELTVKAKRMAQALLKKAERKKKEIKEIFGEVESRLAPSQPIVFEGSSSWPVCLLGPAASKVCQKYKIPCFLFQKGKKQSRGGVRSPQGVDALKAMSACSDLLEGYGGHAPAAGFSIKNENLSKFQKCLEKHFHAQ